MFERYTEKARRVIFFARYEASSFGSPYIESEHLLLGLFRESRAAFRSLGPAADGAAFRKRLEAASPPGQPFSTSVDLPLATPAKRVLAHAAEEADRLRHSFIGTEHLLLGILREDGSPGARFLAEVGMTAATVREQLGREGVSLQSSDRAGAVPVRQRPPVEMAPLSAASLHVLAHALEEAERRTQPRIEPLDLLSGLLRHQPSPVRHLLARAGADLDRLEALLREAEETGSNES